MTHEAQEQALAKAFPNIIGLSSSGAWMWRNQIDGKWHCCYPDNTPLSDLNAIHEIEKIIPKELKNKIGGYYDMLCAVVQGYATWATAAENVNNWDYDKCSASTTAAQRVEAILKTLGLWEEES